MVRPVKRHLLPTLLCALLIPTAAAGAPFSSLIVFGDSLSDNGNVFAATGFPPAPYDPSGSATAPSPSSTSPARWGCHS